MVIVLSVQVRAGACESTKKAAQPDGLEHG